MIIRDLRQRSVRFLASKGWEKAFFAGKIFRIHNYMHCEKREKNKPGDGQVGNFPLSASSASFLRSIMETFLPSTVMIP